MARRLECEAHVGVSGGGHLYDVVIDGLWVIRLKINGAWGSDGHEMRTK